MGKVIIILCSLLVASLMLYIAMGHDFGDFCITRQSEFTCTEWDVTFLVTFIGSYLVLGALIGAGIVYLWRRLRGCKTAKP
jgi:hypothetical protein